MSTQTIDIQTTPQAAGQKGQGSGKSNRRSRGRGRQNTGPRRNDQQPEVKVDIVPMPVHKPTVATTNVPKRDNSLLQRQPKSAKQAPEGVARKDVLEQVSNSIAASLAAPIAGPPVRFADEFSAEATAVANPWDRFDAPWNALVVDGSIPYTDCFAAVFRNASRAMVIYDPNSGQLQYLYQMYGTVQDDAFAPQSPSAAFFLDLARIEEFYALPTPYAKPTSTYQPHGPMLLAGNPEGDPGNPLRYFWMEAGTEITINYASVGTNFPEFSLDFWSESGNHEDLIVVEGDATQAVLTTVTAGYYAIKARATVAELLLHITDAHFSAAESVCRHLTMPDLLSNITAVEGVRVISASLLYTNTAGPLNKQGRVFLVQQPLEVPWTALVSDGPDIISKSNGSYFNYLENGAYGWLKPSQFEDFNWQNHWRADDGVLYDSFYPLINVSQWLSLYAICETDDGRDGEFTIAYGIEYLTNDTFRAKGPPSTPPGSYKVAMNRLRTMVQYTENPVHMAEIWKSIRSGAKTVFDLVKTYGPTAITAAQVLGGML